MQWIKKLTDRAFDQLKSFRILIWGAFVLFAASPAAITAVTVQEIQDRMADSNARLGSLSFEYSQVLSSSLSLETKKSTGKAYFRKPSELRIEQSEPESQLIIASGKSVYIYTPRFKQVLKDSWKKWSNTNFLFPGLASFGQTLVRMKDDYSWEIQGSSTLGGQKTVLLHLSRKGARPGSEDIYLWVPESDFIPRKTELVMGTLKMTTEVNRLSENPELSADLFKFNKPADSQEIQVP